MFNKYSNSNFNLPTSTCRQKREFEALLYSSKRCKRSYYKPLQVQFLEEAVQWDLWAFGKMHLFQHCPSDWGHPWNVLSLPVCSERTLSQISIYIALTTMPQNHYDDYIWCYSQYCNARNISKQYSNIINLTTAFNQLWRIQPPVRCWSKQPLVIWKQCLK